MGTCQFELSNGEKCGLETETDNIYCRFHKNKNIQHNNLDLLRDYIKITKTDVVDLSYKIFTEISFNNLKLPTYKTILFNYSTFKECLFRDIQFDKKVSFVHTTFYETYFKKVTFKGEIDFSSAIFDNSNVSFDTCIFNIHKQIDSKGEINFTRTNFRNIIFPFINCYFHSPRISFLEAEIESDRFNILLTDIETYDHIYLSLNCEEINLDYLKFENYLEIVSQNYKLVKIFLRKIDFSQMKSALFDNVNFEKTLFTNSNLRTIKFINPKWPLSNGKKILYDELIETDKNELLRLYIQLKRKEEEWGDYIGASDWFFREMETRRHLITSRLKSWMWLKQNVFSFIGLYKLASYYGESYWRPFMWIIAVFFVFSFVYLLNGFPGVNDEINYDLFNSGVFSWCDVWEAFKFSAIAMTFQLRKTIDLQQWSATPLYFTHLMLTLIFVPLFLLALRRKFRR